MLSHWKRGISKLCHIFLVVFSISTMAMMIHINRIWQNAAALHSIPELSLTWKCRNLGGATICNIVTSPNHLNWAPHLSPGCSFSHLPWTNKKQDNKQNSLNPAHTQCGAMAHSCLRLSQCHSVPFTTITPSVHMIYNSCLAPLLIVPMTSNHTKLCHYQLCNRSNHWNQKT